MQLWGVVRGTGKVVLSVLRLPWRAVRMNIAQLKNAKKVHADNILYIRTLLDQATRKSKQRKNGKTVNGTFDQVINSRAPGAPSIETLQRRFLRQKRLALGTCAAIIAISLYALFNGSLLAIATLVSSPPLFFMAALSAQLRLWQLRTRRLSSEEKGGLHDFIAERPAWYFEVLNPEIGRQPGEES